MSQRSPEDLDEGDPYCAELAGKASTPFPSLMIGIPALVLAPMEGVTDAPMRALQTDRGGFQFCVSEFLRVSHSVPPAKVLLRHVPELRNGAKTAAGVPVQVQLLGGDPEKLALTARLAVRLGASAIDLNFGCPAPTVNRHDGGATLLKFPERIRAIVSAVRSSLPSRVPVSAKLRLGWENCDDIYRNAEQAASGGASWVTIHARTRAAGYAPPAHWRYLRRVREELGIPVVANGDIWTLDDLSRCISETGCEHFMLGRGAIADPNLALNAQHQLTATSNPSEPIRGPFGSDQKDWLPLLRQFVDLLQPYSDSPQHSLRRIKQWLNLADRHLGVPWFHEIKRADRVEEILGFQGPLIRLMLGE